MTHICEFTYHRPRSVAEASELARQLGSSSIFLAGGTEVLPDFKRGRDSARHVIALRDIPELGGIRVDDGSLRIGAMVRLEDIVRAPEVMQVLPLLAEAAATIGGPQVRHQGTIGGNFCRAVPCADTPPACIVGEAEVRLTHAGGDWTVKAEEFFTGPRETVLQHGEMLVEIVIPEQPRGSGASYQRFALRSGSALAVASVAARLIMDDQVIKDARIALGAVAPIPLLAVEAGRELTGRQATSDLFASAAKVAAQEAKPISDIRGSAEFRRQLVEVLTTRALAAAAKRAGDETRGTAR
jgi:carbon-monoxide dehydrogenase medium subunit